MEEVTAAALAEAIRSTLDERGLRWVVDQVDQTLDEGVTETVKTEAFESVGSGPGGRRRRQEFFTQRPYSQIEELQLLLEAVRRAVVDIPAMARAIRGDFPTEEGGPRSIHFVSEARDRRDLDVARIANAESDPRLVVAIDELIAEARS
jgi:hypothetical protein